MRKHSADYAIARYLLVGLSVRLFVCHAQVLRQTAKSETFSSSGTHSILFFRFERCDNIPTETRVTGTSNAGGGMKKSLLSTNISFYLGINTIYSHRVTIERDLSNDANSNDLE